MNEPHPLADFRRDVQQQIDAELERQRTLIAPVGAEAGRLVDAAARLLKGGKRFRAMFCHAAYLAGGGTHPDGSLRVAAALELFQAAALIHDDVMDDSAVRRGAPAAHVAFADEHRTRGWERSPERFGLSGAVLAGNLCLVASEQMFEASGLPAEETARARVIFDAMRSQLMAGQMLEFVVSNRGWTEMGTEERIQEARRVVSFKSAKYSIEQPTLIGAEAAGVSEADHRALSRYGLALGEAFQLRDDVLGVFGDPETTGKPAGDDLREGKRTVLLALTLATANEDDSQFLHSLLGNEDMADSDVERARAIITDTGAYARHEAMIEQGTSTAREALASTTGLTGPGRQVLEELIDLTTARNT